MDPLSITASILALIKATDHASQGLRRLWALRQAQENLAALQNEVTDLGVLLRFISERYEAIRSSASGTEHDLIGRHFQHAAATITRLQIAIDEHLTRLDSSGRVMIRHRGFWKQQRLYQFTQELRDTRARLSTAVSVLTIMQSTSMRVPLQISRISSVTNFIDPMGGDVNKEKSHNPAMNTIIDSALDMVVWGESSTSAVVIQARNLMAIQNADVDGDGSRIPLRGLHRVSNFWGAATVEYRFPRWLVNRVLRVSGVWSDSQKISATLTFRAPYEIDVPTIGILFTIIRSGSAQLFEKVLDRQQIPGWATCFGGQYYLLESSLQWHRWDFAEILLRRGADFFDIKADNRTIAEVAAEGASMWPKLPLTYPKLQATLEDVENQMILGSNVAHQIVSGQSNNDLEEVLLQDPQIIHAKDRNGNTPLLCALLHRNIEHVPVLLRHGAQVNICNYNKFTPLDIACSLGSIPIVKALIDTGADVNAVNMGNLSISGGCLVSAINAKHEKLVDYLLDRGANPNYGTWSPMMEAAAIGWTDMVEYLCDRGADPEYIDWRSGAILIACMHGKAECVRRLCDRDVRLNMIMADGSSILEFVVMGGNLEIIEILTEEADRLKGIRITEESRARYWKFFEANQQNFSIKTPETLEAERVAFGELLDSIPQDNRWI